MGLMSPDGLSRFFSLCTGLVKDFLYNPSAPIRPVRSDQTAMTTTAPDERQPRACDRDQATGGRARSFPVDPAIFQSAKSAY
jgi:hypothetical protein